MNFSKTYSLSIALSAALLLGACSFDTPSHVTSQKMRLVEQVDEEVFATQHMNDGVLRTIATQFKESNQDAMAVAVTYDPLSSDNTEAKAEVEAARIFETLKKYGVEKIAVGIVPESDPRYSVTKVSFITYEALGPENCNMMPGYHDRNNVGITDIHNEYDYGCTVETLFARQLADPSDLLGQDGFETGASGRMAENKISGSGNYTPGPRPALAGGESSSGED